MAKWGIAIPDNVVFGDCGSSSLFVIDMGGGVAGFLEGATSTVGPMTFVSYTVNWDNFSTGQSSSFGGGGPLGFVTTWSNQDNLFTNSGSVVGVMSGWVTAGSNICTFLNPSDGTFVN